MAINPTGFPSQAARVIMPDGRWSPVWYKFLRQNIGAKEDDRNLEAGLADVVSDVTDINAHISAVWGVSVSINNQVVGMVKLDGSASGSNFVVVADKFLVAHPSVPGTTIAAFVVGLVDGVSTVGING